MIHLPCFWVAFREPTKELRGPHPPCPVIQAVYLQGNWHHTCYVSQTLVCLSIFGPSGLRKGDEHPAYAPVSSFVPFTL